MLPKTPLTEKIGFALCRVVVPLWILMGVVFKLYAGSPSTLPQTIRDAARGAGIDLGTLLYTLIGLEILAIGVMVMLARFARPMAIFMLSAFCVILIGEIIKQGESCGCFGGIIPVEPWQMLIADGLLLAGVILFRPKVPETSIGPGRAIPIAAGLAIVGIGVSFAAGAVLHKERAQEVIEDDDVVDEPGFDELIVDNGGEGRDVTPPRPRRDPSINPAPRSLPAYWYPDDPDAWVGKPWREVEVFQFMPRWPEGLDEGTHYVVLYSRTCSHCRDMFEFDLVMPREHPTIAIEIPASRTRLTSPAWPLPPDLAENVRLMSLPLGTDWTMITAPTALRIENGIVTCVQEGDHKECFEM
jgi:hypothetical protein